MFTFSCSWSFSKNPVDLPICLGPRTLCKTTFSSKVASLRSRCSMVPNVITIKNEKKNSLGTVLTAKKQFQVACRDITTIPALGPSPSAASSHARSLHHGLPNVPGPPGNRAARLVGIHHHWSEHKNLTFFWRYQKCSQKIDIFFVLLPDSNFQNRVFCMP